MFTFMWSYGRELWWSVNCKAMISYNNKKIKIKEKNHSGLLFLVCVQCSLFYLFSVVLKLCRETLKSKKEITLKILISICVCWHSNIFLSSSVWGFPFTVFVDFFFIYSAFTLLMYSMSLVMLNNEDNLLHLWVSIYVLHDVKCPHHK